MRGSRFAPAIAATALALAAAAPAQADVSLTSGPLTLTVGASPWRISVADSRGPLLTESSTAGLGAHTAAGWSRAIKAETLQRDGDRIDAVAATDSGTPLHVTISAPADGVIRIEAAPVGSGSAPDMMRLGFGAAPGERYFGFGSRSDVVDHRGRDVENYVADGPSRPEDRQYPRAFVPPWASGDRDDSTYYPVPWLLSSRGFGALIARNETSRFHLATDPADSWVAEVDAPAIALELYAGPTPLAALRRFSARTGRQPPPPAPWSFGPWFQTGQGNKIDLAAEAAMIKTQRDADVPVSAAETQMHFLPCGAQRDDPAYNAARTKQFHDAGLAQLVYFNPSLCVSYDPVWREAASKGLLIREATGQPHTYPAFVGGSGPAGFTSEPLSQFDFTAPGAEDFYAQLIKEAVDGGHDGWMEDFGEGVPPSGHAADGATGSALHNHYPVDYHCALERIAQRFGRPLNRHIRSGWTGSARCSPDVWGGDPTTVFGYDGLESALKQALGLGMSGVSRFGSDIGGYNTYGPGENLTPELLARWIEFGAISGVMRTKYSGLAFPSYDRPQVFDKDMLPIWRRYTKLHTDLYPYILAADSRYRATGRPLMAHLALAFPDDPAAAAIDDQLMFGNDLLAAPVVTAGARKRKVYLPRGDWIDWWTGKVTHGPATAETSAALDQLPLFVRRGSVVPMLSSDVDTLAPYGGKGIVRLDQRRDRLTLVAFPKGTWAGSMFENERLNSRVLRRNRGWLLRIRGRRTRLYTIRATLPFAPCHITIRRRLRSGTVVVRPRRPRAGSSACA